MAASLLERDRFLASLEELLRQAAEGQGRIALVSGEAGIGKTAMIERFIEQHQPATRTLWGACEALFTPRPLGPLYDIARQVGGSLRALLERETGRTALFTAFLDELQAGAAPTIVAFEDVHWADEATLDLVKFLGRRIQRLGALFVVTFRDDELGKDHPLWSVIGDLPAKAVARLRIPPLSPGAVATLADQPPETRRLRHSADDLYRVTGGNPFFVTEVLASEAAGVPVTVRDAVLARAARLSPAAREVIEVAAVAPGRIEQELLDALVGPSAPGLEECLALGMLRMEESTIAFRHELARQAVDGTLTPTRRRALHARVLRAMLEPGALRAQAQVARVVHHAAAAGDRALVRRYAPVAAREAAARGAHREAAAQFTRALDYAGDLDAEQRAELLEGLSYECFLTSQLEAAVQARTAALTIWRARDNVEHIGHNLRLLSRLHWHRGKNADAERYAAEAVERLETLPPSRELAMAYANLSHLRMLASDTIQTLFWGTRAIELAERLRDYETVAYALNNIGASEFCAGDERGRAKLERSLHLALEHGYEEHVARAYNNLAEDEVIFRNHVPAMEYLMRGMAYCVERDLSTWEHSLRGNRARARLEQGDWAGAGEDASAILSVPWASAANRIPALLVLGWVRLRRGDPGAGPVLDEARDLALATGELLCIAPMAAARAERGWLQGKRDRCLAEAEVGFRLALTRGNPWHLGETAFWLWRGGGLTEAPGGTPAPYALQIAGDWRGAAAAWEQLGCPYERALALADGDEPAQRAALAIFERLGAAPAAIIVRRRLHAAGVRGLSRGPRAETRANPQGLTPRQLEVLALLAEGLRNPEIADRLSTTPKTVEHHVSAVLAKLDARSRAEAVRLAHELGLLPQKSHAAHP